MVEQERPSTWSTISHHVPRDVVREHGAETSEMTIDVQDAEPEIDARRPPRSSREEHRSAIVLFVTVVIVFRQVTDMAWDAAGNAYISDGYINSRIAKVDKMAIG